MTNHKTKNILSAHHRSYKSKVGTADTRYKTDAEADPKAQNKNENKAYKNHQNSNFSTKEAKKSKRSEAEAVQKAPKT